VARAFTLCQPAREAFDSREFARQRAAANPCRAFARHPCAHIGLTNPADLAKPFRAPQMECQKPQKLAHILRIGRHCML